jgi:flagellar protein FliO/FliZ
MTMTAAASPGFWEIIQYLASFTLVILLLLSLLFLLKRLQHGKMFKAGGQRLHVVESRSLGTRQRLVLVRLDQQELLLGVGANEVHTLLVQPALTGPVEQAEATAVAASPLDLIQRWRKR